MRKHLPLFFIFAFLLLQVEGYFLHGQKLNPGWFYHKPSNTFLFIEKADRSLLVKKSQESSWVVFSKKKSGLYFDRFGNRIEIWNQNKVSYVPFKSRKGRVYSHRTEVDQAQNNNQPHDTGFPDIHSKEGLWYSVQDDVHVIIVDSREGIKARLKDSRNWESYLQQGNADVFISSSGDKYFFEGNQLIYHHHDGIHSLRFTKISDSFDGY